MKALFEKNKNHLLLTAGILALGLGLSLAPRTSLALVVVTDLPSEKACRSASQAFATHPQAPDYLVYCCNKSLHDEKIKRSAKTVIRGDKEWRSWTVWNLSCVSDALITQDASGQEVKTTQKTRVISGNDTEIQQLLGLQIVENPKDSLFPALLLYNQHKEGDEILVFSSKYHGNIVPDKMIHLDNLPATHTFTADLEKNLLFVLGDDKKVRVLDISGDSRFPQKERQPKVIQTLDAPFLADEIQVTVEKGVRTLQFNSPGVPSSRLLF